MIITEKQLRHLIREMALKGINITRAQQMDNSEVSDIYRSPDESGVFPTLYYPNYPSTLLSPELSAEDMYQATVRAWGRESYKSYAARQFERFPIGLNVFLVPGAKGEKSLRFNVEKRFTDPDDPAMNEKGLRIIRQHFPDVPIDNDDFNIVLLTQKADINTLGVDPNKDQVPPPKVFLDTQGVYNTFHALFDRGILSDRVQGSGGITGHQTAMKVLTDKICAIVGAEGYSKQKKLLVMGENSPLNSVFRLRTLRMKRVEDSSELANELFTVALIRQTVPVRPEEFPTHDINGVEIPEEKRQEGIDLVNQMIPLLENARDSWKYLAGKTIIGSSTPST